MLIIQSVVGGGLEFYLFIYILSERRMESFVTWLGKGSRFVLCDVWEGSFLAVVCEGVR